MEQVARHCVEQVSLVMGNSDIFPYTFWTWKEFMLCQHSDGLWFSPNGRHGEGCVGNFFSIQVEAYHMLHSKYEGLRTFLSHLLCT